MLLAISPDLNATVVHAAICATIFSAKAMFIFYLNTKFIYSFLEW